MQIKPYDPEQTVFEAVRDLEKRGFTKQEVQETLLEVTRSYRSEQHRQRT